MVATVGPLIAIVLGASTGAGAWCAETEKGLSRALEETEFQKEPESALASIFASATAAAAKCPQSEGLAYLRIRSAELGRGQLIGAFSLDGGQELQESAAEAAQRFPQSARILTVRARVSRDGAAARRAVTIDPTYLPGRVVLGDILVDAGEWAEAEKVLPSAQGVRDVLTVRARVDLARGDARAALERAERAVSAPRMDSAEPDARDPGPVRRAHAVAALAAIALGRFQRAAVHLSDVNPDDPLIRDVLRAPPKELARALRARRARPAN